jgi:hypothetical protein
MNHVPQGFFDNYRRYAEIVAELQLITAKYPTLTKFTPSIGKSLEGRDIPAITISALGFNNATVNVFIFHLELFIRESFSKEDNMLESGLVLVLLL